jgi:ATP-dependent RNA helicase HelY
MIAPDQPGHLAQFSSGLDFELDDFQREACESLAQGRGVLVAAPTGAGKTLVGEFAVYLALATGRKAFYTTPIKALSNQKYADLVRVHGASRVGLLTGDSSINGEAPIVVMTTEVLRNMMYAESPTLADLGYVVMDEVHYLADRTRGAVWEEVIIHLPEDVIVVSLSATVSNAEEFGEWLRQVRGDVDIVVSEERPVPLFQHLLVGTDLMDLFVRDNASTRVNPAVTQRIETYQRRTAYTGGDRRHPRNRARHDADTRPRGGRPTTSRAQTIIALDRAGLLPAITFIFSRAGCDAAVGQLIARDVRLVSDKEARRIRRVVEERVAGLPEEDLAVLGYWDFVDGLSRGFAAHHAGMLPTFREIVEELFTAGLVQAVFATETLALGINMPARTVVLERLVKFNGDTHAELTPAEYTQLTGRAGRRGIDVEGHAVVVWHPGVDPDAVGGLASTRTFPLRSSFRPTSTMAVNLVGHVGRDEARELLELSFAQFQADRGVVGLARSIRRDEAKLTEYAARMECHLGEFAEYAALREKLRSVEKSASQRRSVAERQAIEESLAGLRPGDVVRIPRGRHAGYAVVITADRGGYGHPPAPSVLTEDRQVRRLAAADVTSALAPVLTVRLPRDFNPRQAKSRRDLAATLRIRVAHEPPAREPGGRHTRGRDSELEQQVTAVRRELRAHPCHECPDREEHARWGATWWRLRRDVDGAIAQVESRTNTVARTFDRVCSLLDELGYLADHGQVVTDAGRMLSRLYTEKDLLTAECLRSGVWNTVDAAGLAAAVSTLVHESRRDDGQTSTKSPPGDVIVALDRMHQLWVRLIERELAHGLQPTSAPDPSIAWSMHRWARGHRLDDVLRGTDLAPGDFVRRCKQVVDLLGQLADCAPHPALAAKARRAADSVMRGVVAADRLD